ncbi:hypothetical protein ACUL41_15745 [Virgibacillus natechei]
MEVATIVREKGPDYKSTPDEDGLWKKLIADLFEEFMLFFAPDLYEEIDFSIPLLLPLLQVFIISRKKTPSSSA